MSALKDVKALIIGVKGLELSEGEVSFCKEHKPWGLILFQRNCENREQISALCEAFRKAVDRDNAPVFIDQEGGRVQRMRPPISEHFPPASWIGKIAEHDFDHAMRLSFIHGYLIGADLAEVGINADCLPVLDVAFPETHDVIGDRAFSANPVWISHLAGEQVRGLKTAGVAPVMKHIPGHGRATADSHFTLPNVDAPTAALHGADFQPFMDVDCQMAMTAHVTYSDIDATAPATLSKKVVNEVIRGTIGYGGLLMTDDLSMRALSGPFCERVHKSLDAGCDMILHCNGDMAEMLAISEAVPVLTGDALDRVEAIEVLSVAYNAENSVDRSALLNEFSAALAKYPT